MSCKTVNEKINGHEYSCTQYPAIDGMEFKLEVIKILGPAISGLVPYLKSNEDDNIQVAALSSAIEKLFYVASPKELTNLIIRMLTTGHTKRDGERLTETLFNQIYAGDDMMEAYKVFIFILKVNYAGFFKGQKAEALLAKMEDNL